MGVKAPRKGNSASNFFDALFPGTSQKLAFTATTSQSAAVGSTTTLVRMISTQNVHIKIGASPTAVADGTSMYLPLGVAIVVGVTPSDKIAAVRDSADGNLFITEATSV